MFSLVRIVESTRYIPIGWRKFGITFTRVQAPIDRNTRLTQELLLQSSSQHSVWVDHGRNSYSYSISEFADDLNTFFDSPAILSVLSYVFKAEDFDDLNEAEQVIPAGVSKEISAAIQGDREQRLDYRSLFSPTGAGINPSSDKGEVVMQAWRGGIARFIAMLDEQGHVYIPIYQKRKNIGWVSQDMLQARKGMPPGASYIQSLNQCDLLKHYHETGEMVGGPMEMRSAWRLNDLKSRTYYAGGGEAFWKSMFIKTIVLDLLQLLPSTNPGLRYDATRLTMYTPLQQGEVVITYDYSSFTTSLAELKYFLSYLAIQLSGVRLDYLDVWSGVEQMDLGQYIADYNDSINVNAEFDASRVHDLETLVMLRQTRNGMLGAQGNIGFSTLLHGLHIASIVTSDPHSVVGDDALGRILEDEQDTAISLSQDLCEIEAAKFHIWYPADLYSYTQEDAYAQQYQYLKRPLTITGTNMIQTGSLPDYPNVGLLEPSAQVYKLRTFRDGDFEVRATTIVRQWGSFLRRIVGYGRTIHSVMEADVILAPMQEIYKKIGIPEKGGIPSMECAPTVEGEKPFILQIFAPPVNYAVFTSRWEDLVVDGYLGETVTFPRYSEGSVPPPPHVEQGDVFISTSHRIQRLMVDFGYFDRVVCQETFRLSTDVKEYIRRILGDPTGLRMLSTYTVIENPPTWYEEILLAEGDDYYTPDTYSDNLTGDVLQVLMGME